MFKKTICSLGFAFAIAAALPVPALSQHSGMPGMSGMKDSTVKKKPSPKKPKARTAVKKKTTRKTTAAPKKGTASAKKHPASTQMADSALHMKHDSTAATSGGAMPGMVGMPGMTHSDSAHSMPMMDSSHVHDTAAVHGGMNMPMPKTDSMAMPGMTPAGTMKPMSADDMMIGPLGISMERMGSGTTWIPDAVTMPSRRTMMGSWMIMGHGFAFAQYDHQSGARGDDQFGSLNWAMLMATKDVAGGRFQARTMLSLDALTVTSKGYPLLLQTGETFDGVPLHDRQHPHDFWMELGALYQRRITPSLGWSVYAAPSGEPALGPVAFMHRPSAMDNPTAPIAHHWQDATHVSFGVITGGLFTHTVQLEASAFNGREPDQNRWNFDPIKLDSYSSRVTINPSDQWSFSAGYGYLKSPEAADPELSSHRVTASLLNGRRIGSDGQVSTALIWGANKRSDETRLSHSVLAESEAILDASNTIFGRAEHVEKSAEDLVVDIGSSGLAPGQPGFPPSQRFNVSTLQLGYIRELARLRWVTIGLGAAATLNFVPSTLQNHYGSRTPAGTFVFLRVRPFHDARRTIFRDSMEENGRHQAGR